MVREAVYAGAALFSAVGIITFLMLTADAWATYQVVLRRDITGARRLIAWRDLCEQATQLTVMTLFVAVSVLALNITYEERTPGVRFLILVMWLGIWGILILSGLHARRYRRELLTMLGTQEQAEGDGQ